MAPWADTLFAMDADWWFTFLPEVREVFKGDCFTVNTLDKVCGIPRVPRPFTGFGNSGAGAINLARFMGAKKIIMLGYDCRHIGEKKHWHGSHPKHLADANMVNKWPAHFDRLAKVIPADVDVVNCTKGSAVTAFRFSTLDKEL